MFFLRMALRFHPPLNLAFERVLEGGRAFLPTSCGHLPQNHPLWAISSGVLDPQNMCQVIVVVNDVLWINRFLLGMHTSHFAS